MDAATEVKYILESPGSLSDRAITFLRTASRRVPFDTGLTGNALRSEIFRVYGRPNEKIVSLLHLLQSRYGGLSYKSGFFQSEVRFSPVCEPEDPDEELEILYAVDTESPVGASVKATGEVEVGLDGAGVVEFPCLDFLIECDAMFAAAETLGTETRRFLSVGVVSKVLQLLQADEFLKLRPVPNASGAHSWWLESDSVMVFVTSVWTELGLGIAPMLRAWSPFDAKFARIDDVLTVC